jgi:hypothetical protein
MTSVNEINLNNLSINKANILVLKLLSLIKEYQYIDFINWSYEDVSVEDLYMYLKKTYSNIDLKDGFILLFLEHAESKKQYDVIEGFFSLIKFFEENERYEDCIVLKGFKDILLLDLQLSN